MPEPVTTDAVTDIAARLDGAVRQREAVAQLDHPIELADAYRVQHALLQLRRERGERLVGTKLGFTSKAKMAQMGVSEVIAGQLTDAMALADGGTAHLDGYIHPRIEPEIAFRLGRDVDPRTEGADLVEAVTEVAPAMEIIDSRYRDFSFSLGDVVADNTSAAGYVIGSWRPLGAVGDLADLEVRLEQDGEVRTTGSTAAILGHPFEALRALATLAGRHAFPLRAGDVILAGAATEAIPFGAGRYEVHVAQLGSAGVRCVP